MSDECGTCRFWKPRSERQAEEPDDELDPGECHRHAPTPSHGGFEIEMLSHLSLVSWMLADDPEKQLWSNNWEDPIGEASWWPGTWRSDWCGEFMPGASHER